jgi:hypothetical protein
MVAVRVTPLYVAEITDVATAVTGVVDTNVGPTQLLTPAGTVSVAGTVTAAVLLLENATTAPPLGAGTVSVTVADAVEPPCTLAGLRLTVSRVAVGGGAGEVTVMVAVRVTPLYVAEMTDVVVEVTALVATEVAADVAPARTVRVAGTVTAPVLLLVSDTTAPPVGAGAVSVTVAEAVAPPGIELALSAWGIDQLGALDLVDQGEPVHEPV